MPTISPVVQARHLTKRYGPLVAVDHISFEILPGECFGFLGPNGAGKTSTMRMIYGVSPLSGGSLRVFGLEVQHHAREIKARLGVCPQEQNLDVDFNVEENLLNHARYFGIPRKEARRRARDLLAFFALEHRARSPLRELSGGMKRRLQLARALIHQPELLVLDEPTVGLDPQSRHAVWERIDQLKQQGLTVILTTHYMEEAEKLCDRLVIMDHGRILVQGPPRDLVLRFVGQEVLEIRPAEPWERPLRNRFPHLEIQRVGDRLEVFLRPEHEAERSQLLHTVRARDLYLRRASLEDVFLKLTGRELRE